MRNFLDELKMAKRCAVPLINIVTPDQHALIDKIVETFDKRVIVDEVEKPRPLCPIVSWDLINGFQGKNNLGDLALIYVAAKLGGKDTEQDVQSAIKLIKPDGKSAQQLKDGQKAFNSLKEAARKVIRKTSELSKAPITDCITLAALFPEDSIVVAMNFHQYLKASAQSMPANAQALMNLRDQYKSQVQVWGVSRNGWGTGTRTFVTLMAEMIPMPSEIQQSFLYLDEDLPDEERRKSIIVDLHVASEVEVPDEQKLQAAVDATTGMNDFSIEQETALSITPVGIDLPRLEQRAITLINSQPGMRVWDGNESFADVGGNRNLITYLKTLLGNNKPGLVQFCDEIEKAFSGSAIGSSGQSGDSSGTSQGMLGEYLKWYVDKGAYGILIVGPGGTGKTLAAKCAGNYAGVKTVSFDMKGMQSPFVGQSTQNLLKNLRIIDSFSPRYPLVIATTNDPELLPPELRSRFDVTFYTPMPDKEELQAIWKIQTSKFEFSADEAKDLPDDYGWVGRDIFKCCRKSKFMKIPLVSAARFISPARISAAKSIAYLNHIAQNNGYINASTEGPYVQRVIEEYESPFSDELKTKGRKVDFNGPIN